MVFAELDRRTRWARAHRMKLGIQMLTTSAYGALGVAVADPVLRSGPFGPGQLASLAFGLVCAFAALYLAPQGDAHGIL